MKAYKYYDARVETKILGEGTFRIGTLYDYRRTEEHGTAVGDNSEGKVGANSRVISWSSASPVIRDEHARSFVQGNALVLRAGSAVSFGPGGSIAFGAQGVSLQNIGLRSELEVENMFVFSTSRSARREDMVAMGYTACYEISDLEAFVAILSRDIPGVLLGVQPVQYAKRELHYEAARRSNPAWIKEPHFQYQNEVRALWQPNGRPASAILVTSLDAAKLCSKIAL